MDYYELLGVPRSASTEEVRDAYVRLVKRVHPDSGGSAALFRQVEEAYRVLSDPSERRLYDQGRSSPGGGGGGGGAWGSAGGRPRPGPTMPTPQAVVEEALIEGAKWVKGVAEKRSAKRDEQLRELQAVWPKQIGLDFLRVDLKAWQPFLMAAVPGETRCSASWARHDIVEPPMSLLALRVDLGEMPRLLIWKVEGTDDDWVSWRAASPDGTEIELRMRIEASPGCRPRWGRRRLPAGTHMVVDHWS